MAKATAPGVDDTLDIETDVSADVTLAPTFAEAPDAVTDPEGYAKYVHSLRQTRKPFGSMAQKLALPARQGYKRHWFNDVGGRVQEYKDAGWTHVLDPQTRQPVKRTVGSGRDNRALMAYAMELPSVLWDEVQQLQFNEASAKMEDVKRSPVRAPAGLAQASDKEKFYSPRDEIVSVGTSLAKSK